MYLETRNLTKRFGGLTAISGVDFGIERGKVNAIIGPNGAGKSTFFHLITGIHRPSEGEVLFKGKDISKLPPNKIAELGVARTFQTTNLFERATVFENVVVGHRLRTRSNLFDAVFRTKRLKEEEEKCKEKALKVLDFAGLSAITDRVVTNISQEEKKRVAFALALATDPEVIFLDEPTAGVNPDETEELSLLIEKMAQKGITVCLIEHKMKMIMNMADKIMVLNYGEKIAEGTPEEINNNDEVIKAYLGGDASA
ncbi:ABC transporter ATP-binding protein [Virgibacillus xinjiangensis]|uniref:ABC transporter ATP-binding protein n=1 Tax=Virgibacillus xinjiangensis TaxID=393090 RepID=A0ABV7CZE2_9BACI